MTGGRGLQRSRARGQGLLQPKSSFRDGPLVGDAQQPAELRTMLRSPRPETLQWAARAGLNTADLLFSQFWEPEVHHQGAGRATLPLESWLLLPLQTQGIPGPDAASAATLSAHPLGVSCGWQHRRETPGLFWGSCGEPRPPGLLGLESAVRVEAEGRQLRAQGGGGRGDHYSGGAPVCPGKAGLELCLHRQGGLVGDTRGSVRPASPDSSCLPWSSLGIPLFPATALVWPGDAL